MFIHNRRLFLKGLGTTLALPYLESASLYASTKTVESSSKMISIALGFGVTQESWFPELSDTGKGYKLPTALAPLEKHKKDFSLIQNVQNQFSTQAHWGSTFYITGANPYAIPGKSFHNTISMDQVAAQALGDKYRYSSLRFNPRSGANGHGPGLSLSWDQNGKPLPGLNGPLAAYNKLFGNSGLPIEERRKLIKRKSSSLDAILLEVKDLQRELNVNDKNKLSEYLDSIRNIELQLMKEEIWLDKPKPKAPFAKPSNGHIGGVQEVKLMYDLMVAALQTNSTPVMTYRLPAESFLQSLGITLTPHDLSHYAGKSDRQADSHKRDLKHAEILSHLFDRLKAVEDINGESLFENTAISFGTELRSGHTKNNVATLLAGNTKKMKHGSHICMPKDTPLCNVWLTMLRSIGVEVESFGDSTKTVSSLL